MIIQIYEIQSPEDAQQMIDFGVDHIGSVIVSENHWKQPGIKATIDRVRLSSSRSSIIPLFNTPDTVFRALEYYQPDIVQFCETIADHPDVERRCLELVELQSRIREQFSAVDIMRSIPIGVSGMSSPVPTLRIAEIFEPVSDYFLTDTLLMQHPGTQAFDEQPVNGFVGITGQISDWNTAAELVASSRIPVILAGGISPDNVYDAIRRVRPAGVDSCTLTNAVDVNKKNIRFKKDPDKVIQLVREVRRAEKDMLK